MPQITIHYNCRNGNFHFHPDPLSVPYNANSTITWKVVGKHVPSAGSVQFPGTDGIVFGSSWPGTTPVIDPDDPAKYSASDNNNSSNTVGDFKYTTTLVFNDGKGQTTNPTYDPDVENQGPPATVSRA